MELRLQKAFRIVLPALVTLAVAVSASGQVAGTPPVARTPQSAPAPPAKTRATRRPNAPVVIDSKVAAPQVVTILHRLDGLKMFRLLLRSGEEIGAITKLDEAFRMKDEVHTSVIAGLAMDDGETIAARLPEAAAELDPTMAFADACASASPRLALAFPGVKGTAPISGQGFLAGAANLFDRPDVTVIGRDGRRIVARYIGLDGVTGISVLKLAGHNALERT